MVAVLLCSAWVLCLELGPNLHIGFHKLFAPHHHHGDAPGHNRDGDSGGSDGPEHGSNSVAHHGVATLQAPTPLLVLGVVLVPSEWWIKEPKSWPSNSCPTRIHNRGPPNGAHLATHTARS